MRANLSEEQKNYLTRIARERDVMFTDDMMKEELAELVKMNDHECIYQNADRFLGDLYTHKLYGRT